LDRQKTPCESTVVQGWRHQGRCILPSNNALRGTVPNTVEISIPEPQPYVIVHDLFIKDCGCNHSDSGGKALRRNRQHGNGKNLEFAKLASHNPKVGAYITAMRLPSWRGVSEPTPHSLPYFSRDLTTTTAAAAWRSFEVSIPTPRVRLVPSTVVWAFGIEVNSHNRVSVGNVAMAFGDSSHLSVI